MFSLSDYIYELPEELIAQKPEKKRDQSRLLLLDRNTGRVSHYHFHQIQALLHPNDLLVVNNTRVVPGRLHGRKQTGGKVELLILNYGQTDSAQSDGGRVYRCLIKASKQAAAGTRLMFDEGLVGEVTVDLTDSIATGSSRAP